MLHPLNFSSNLDGKSKKICSKSLPRYAWPTEYEFVDELPVTKLGKIDFKLLQEYEKENNSYV